jgi:hypothetical protein
MLFTEEGKKILYENLFQNNTLIKLSLNKNEINNENCLYLDYIIKNNNNLKFLDLQSKKKIKNKKDNNIYNIENLKILYLI